MVERQPLDSQRGKQMSDERFENKSIVKELKDEIENLKTELKLKDIVIASITLSLKKYLRAFDIACERIANAHSSPFDDNDAYLKKIKSEILKEAEKEKE